MHQTIGHSPSDARSHRSLGNRSWLYVVSVITRGQRRGRDGGIHAELDHGITLLVNRKVWLGTHEEIGGPRRSSIAAPVSFWRRFAIWAAAAGKSRTGGGNVTIACEASLKSIAGRNHRSLLPRIALIRRFGRGHGRARARLANKGKVRRLRPERSKTGAIAAPIGHSITRPFKTSSRGYIAPRARRRCRRTRELGIAFD